MGTGLENAAGALYLGLDVQIKRPCPYFMLTADLEYAGSGWLAGETPQEISFSLRALVDSLAERTIGRVGIGIDAPRLPLPAPRQYYWRKGGWIKRSEDERGYGRHCEVVIKALNIANPQWSPLVGEAPAWMELGFSLFGVLESYPDVYEVFPTASYRLLENQPQPPIRISFRDFGPGPKDMLDAAVAAYTLAEFAAGRGCEVGGGDGLGTIVLPRCLPALAGHPVLTWPG